MCAYSSRRPASRLNVSHRARLRLQIFLALGAFCGLRAGEIRGLTQDSIDFDNRFIRVRHNLTEFDELKEPKTKSGNRDTPMPVHIQELLELWCVKYYISNERNLVLTSLRGSSIAQTVLTYSWYNLLRRAGLFIEGDVLHFHALRHFAASRMIQAGLPITDVAAVLGHSKVDMTLSVYAHALTEKTVRRDVFESMATSLAPQEAPALAQL